MILSQQRTLPLQLHACGTIAILIRRVHHQRHGSSLLLLPVVNQTAVVQTQKKWFLRGGCDGSPTRRSFTPTITTTATPKRQIRSLHASQLWLSSSSSTTASEPSAPPPPPPLTNIQDPNTQQPEDPQLVEFSLEFPPPQYELPIIQPPSPPHTVLKVKNDTPPTTTTTTSPYDRFLGPRFHHVVQKLVSVPYQQNILWQSEGLFQLASQQAKNPYVRLHTQAQSLSLCVSCLLFLSTTHILLIFVFPGIYLSLYLCTFTHNVYTYI
jgi:hypothetical protein